MVRAFQQIKWEDPYLGDTGEICLITVDGTTFRISEPRPFKKETKKYGMTKKQRRSAFVTRLEFQLKQDVLFGLMVLILQDGGQT